MMKIKYFCPLWGSEELAFDRFCEKVAAAGYDGVEMSLPLNDTATTEARTRGPKKQGLDFLGQHWETTAPDVDEYVAEYVQHLEWLAAADPVLINSQTGRDWFSFEDNVHLIEAAQSVARKTGVRIVHETHRGKFSYSARVTRRFLEQCPDLRITADFSHWCNVSESLLQDQPEAMGLAISRADHFHARVGHIEGPQISDPRAPEWSNELNAHLGWWDRIVATHRERGSELLTVTPEFGPFPYMPMLPYTRQPIVSQWEVNVYMMQLLRERYDGND
jgi:sugar phosphate isomerase/epimerase